MAAIYTKKQYRADKYSPCAQGRNKIQGHDSIKNCGVWMGQGGECNQTFANLKGPTVVYISVPVTPTTIPPSSHKTNSTGEPNDCRFLCVCEEEIISRSKT